MVASVLGNVAIYRVFLKLLGLHGNSHCKNAPFSSLHRLNAGLRCRNAVLHRLIPGFIHLG